ncbi:MAG: ribonuclease HI [Clostridiales bacterium]|jgi:ribonuclease HI|nr:ribonuclease HI [Clostridiales bacterium]
MHNKTSNLKTIALYTDGACSGNPGRGGWAAILIYTTANGAIHTKELSGYMPSTTNNRMEMFSIIQGLGQLKESCNVLVHSDSAYVVNAFNNGWIDNWQRNNWKTSDKKEVKNMDLWKDLLSKLSMHEYTFVKVKGHADNEYNNRCDKLAVAACKSCSASNSIFATTKSNTV